MASKKILKYKVHYGLVKGFGLGFNVDAYEINIVFFFAYLAIEI